MLARVFSAAGGDVEHQYSRPCFTSSDPVAKIPPPMVYPTPMGFVLRDGARRDGERPVAVRCRPPWGDTRGGGAPSCFEIGARHNAQSARQCLAYAAPPVAARLFRTRQEVMVRCGILADDDPPAGERTDRRGGIPVLLDRQAGDLHRARVDVEDAVELVAVDHRQGSSGPRDRQRSPRGRGVAVGGNRRRRPGGSADRSPLSARFLWGPGAELASMTAARSVQTPEGVELQTASPGLASTSSSVLFTVNVAACAAPQTSRLSANPETMSPDASSSPLLFSVFLGCARPGGSPDNLRSKKPLFQPVKRESAVTSSARALNFGIISLQKVECQVRLNQLIQETKNGGGDGRRARPMTQWNQWATARRPQKSLPEHPHDRGHTV